jgi:hypothetical protein
LTEKIKKYEAEMGYLKDDIDAADKEVENLTEEIKKIELLSKQIGILSRSQIIKTIKQLLTNAVHNVSLCVPSVLDLVDLNLFDIKASVNVKIACDYDSKIKDHKNAIDQYLPLENLSFRVYDGKDRWCATQDGDAFFLAIVGKDPNIYLSILTTDPVHLKFFNSIAMDSWLRGHKMP